jgi:hypothetical protein
VPVIFCFFSGELVDLELGETVAKTLPPPLTRGADTQALNSWMLV